MPKWIPEGVSLLNRQEHMGGGGTEEESFQNGIAACVKVWRVC